MERLPRAKNPSQWQTKTNPERLGTCSEAGGNYYACMLNPKKKQSVIKKYQTHEGDTGSSEVQIAILTAEIEELIEHLKGHPKDHSSRRGLLRKVSARRRLMRYLKKENAESFEEISKKLKIKQARKVTKPGATLVDEKLDEESELIDEDEPSE